MKRFSLVKPRWGFALTRRVSQGALRDPGLWNLIPSAYPDKGETQHGNGKRQSIINEP
jgi:hypothetical protein